MKSFAEIEDRVHGAIYALLIIAAIAFTATVWLLSPGLPDWVQEMTVREAL